MDALVKAVHEFVQTQGVDRRYVIAYSGGLDSHVLLHLMASISSLTLRAVYINHGVSPHAIEWAAHCERVCASLGVEFVQQMLTIKNHENNPQSPEDRLRQLRYHCLAELMADDDVLLTAHHQNDQAETVLLQLLRGAGPKGLAAMPRVKSFAKGLHGRPLLDFTRVELMHYAKEHQLQWIDDESNRNTRFTRNFLRHDIMPILMERFPQVTKMLARSASHCAESQQLIEATALQLLTDVGGTLPHTLSVKKLIQLDQAKQKQVLRMWILQSNFPLPSQLKMTHILNDMLHARDDKTPHVTWHHVEVRRYRDNLFLLSISNEHDVTKKYEWNLHEPLLLPSIGELHAILKKGYGIRANIQSVTVQFRQGGEVIRLPGRQHHHDLKKLFQTWGVPTWQRKRMPLIFVEQTLAAVIGFCVADEFVAREDEMGWEVCLYPFYKPIVMA